MLFADGRRYLPRLVPKDPLTGYTNPRCYLKHTNGHLEKYPLMV
jgi:hypothetical protein